jgi:hypothetical protein
MIPEFVKTLEDMRDIHEKKNRDYAGNNNPFENFERAATITEWFNDPVDKSFVNLIGTKLARLSTLLNRITPPNNESIDDSFLDLATYIVLWKVYHIQKKETYKNDLIQRRIEAALE